MQKITPFLWFNDRAEEALNFYLSVFKNSKIVSLHHYPDSVPGMGGKVMHAIFRIEGQEFMAIDGGPMYKFTEAISLFVNCESQEEVDHLWNTLSADGEVQQCGWLKDKYGVSWQIIPSALGELMGDPDPVKSGRVVQAMLKMKKIIIQDLEDAYSGK